MRGSAGLVISESEWVERAGARMKHALMTKTVQMPASYRPSGYATFGLTEYDLARELYPLVKHLIEQYAIDAVADDREQR